MNKFALQHLWLLRTLTPTLMGVGVLCLILGAGKNGLASLGLLGWLGMAALIVAATLGAFGVVAFQSAADKLAGLARTAASEHELAPLPQELDPFFDLTAAVNECIRMAEGNIERSAAQSREMEIELKVATSQRQHAEAVINSINDAVLVTDPFDEILFANAAAGQVLGFDPLDAPRRALSDVVREEAVVGMISRMRQAGLTHGKRTVEHDIASGDEQNTYKVTLSGVADGNDRPAGVVTVLQDMTREREVAKAKNDFVGSVTHELRTPLASINAYIEMLLDGEAEDPETRKQFCEIIQSEGQRLGKLIDNILNISRIESGVVKVNKVALSPVLVVKEALEVIRPTAKLKSITVNEQLPPSTATVEADKDMLYQAVLNLLSNAVKYTPDGGSVDVSVEFDDASNEAVVRVADTGLGIPEDDLPRIFEKFYRVKANEKAAKGTGLGLPLVKHVVEDVHGGRITATSTVGQGTTFGLHLAQAA